MKKYALTDAHRAHLKPWAEKWTANAMSTKAMDDKERDICRKAVVALYNVAGLKPPRVVFAPSPFVVRFAGGFAAAIWHKIKGRAATYDATDAATRAATYETYAATDDATRAATYETYDAMDAAMDAATRAATRAATYDATRAATDAATRAATYAATYDATRAATYDATRAATYAATYDATDAATRAATYETYAATDDATRAATYETYDAMDAAMDAATRAATRAATYDATRAATDAATRAATYAATYDATDAATRAATYAATYAATGAATRAATYAATYAATHDATDDATDAATHDATRDDSKWFTLNGQPEQVGVSLKLGALGERCCVDAWRMWQGGNQWSAWVGFLSFFRYVAKLNIDYSKWDAWEKLCEHSGPRVVHPEFCIISDRPERLLVDDQNRPHCDDGPFCRWRDGSALYAVHGVRVPAWIIIRPKDITVEKIEGEQNAEIRRVMIGKFGRDRYMRESGCRELHRDDFGILFRKDVPGDEPMVMVEVVNSTAEPDGSFKNYWLQVHPELRPLPPGNWPEEKKREWLRNQRPQAMTARNAVASTFSMRGEEYEPSIQT